MILFYFEQTITAGRKQGKNQKTKPELTFLSAHFTVWAPRVHEQCLHFEWELELLITEALALLRKAEGRDGVQLIVTIP